MKLGQQQAFANCQTLPDPPENPLSVTATTSRLTGAVDNDLMAASRIVGIGVGGAVGLYEDLARTNLGHLTTLDFDVVDESNLATQGFDVSDVGTHKVEALRKRLLAATPTLNYRPVCADFLKLSEAEIEAIVSSADLLLMMTDNFHAQARGNLVALKYQIPAVFAIVYQQARCSEITFTIPGITPACHRCAVSSRYQAYREGYTNLVRQQSSTVFHTHYLNSCLGLLVLAILHRNTTGLEFTDSQVTPAF